MRSYRIEGVIEEYRGGFEELKRIAEELSGFEKEAREHGEVERHLQKRGLEVMRRLFQQLTYILPINNVHLKLRSITAFIR